MVPNVLFEVADLKNVLDNFTFSGKRWGCKKLKPLFRPFYEF
jgi:hypothetical protein